ADVITRVSRVARAATRHTSTAGSSSTEWHDAGGADPGRRPALDGGREGAQRPPRAGRRVRQAEADEHALPALEGTTPHADAALEHPRDPRELPQPCRRPAGARAPRAVPEGAELPHRTR